MWLLISQRTEQRQLRPDRQNPGAASNLMMVPPVRLERTLLAELDFESSASTIPPRGLRDGASLAETGAARQVAKAAPFEPFEHWHQCDGDH